MANNFEVYTYGDVKSHVEVPVASATVIEPWKLIALVAWLYIEATAWSTAIGYTDSWTVDWETSMLIVDPRTYDELVLQGTATQALAATDLWITCDVAISGTDQLIDLANSATNVLKVLPDERAWNAGDVYPIRVSIAVSV